MIREHIVEWWRDARHAARVLAAKPLFTASIVLTLAVGVGANTAMFSAVYAVLLRPLPYKDSDRLVAIWGELRKEPGSKVFASYGDFQALRNNGRSFEDVAALTWFGSSDQTLEWKDESYRIMAIPVSDNFFSLLGTQPLLGRTFTSDDLNKGCAVVLSYALWQHELGGVPDVVTRSLSVNNNSCGVVGVMPSSFTFYPRNDGLWTLITASSNIAKNPRSSVAIVARLKPGVLQNNAHTESKALHEAVAADSPPGSWVREISPVVYPLHDEFTWLAGRNLQSALWMLFAAVAMVLLIACVNIAGLMTSHAAERERELAVRAALGCGRLRIIRQLLLESLLLALAGAVAGGMMANAGVSYFRSTSPIELPPGNIVSVNVAVLTFTAGIALIAGLAFGVIPGLRASRLDLNEVLKSGGTRIARNWLSSRSGIGLVVGEIALSVTLVLGAALLIQSIQRLSDVPLGFQPDGLVALMSKAQDKRIPAVHVETMNDFVTQNFFVTVAGTSVVLLIVTVLATYMPARRAAKIDPIIALKHE